MLHDEAKLREDEVERAEQLGLTTMHGATLAFALPCRRLDGNVCTVYDVRPSTCREYECGLLERYRSGATSLDEAIQRVDEAKQLLLDFEGALAPGQTLLAVRTAWRSEARTSGQSIGPVLRFRLIALLRIIDKYFLADREPKYLKSADGQRPTGS